VLWLVGSREALLLLLLLLLLEEEEAAAASALSVSSGHVSEETAAVANTTPRG
jgi:hypothetical protein